MLWLPRVVFVFQVLNAAILQAIILLGSVLVPNVGMSLAATAVRCIDCWLSEEMCV